jgi:hypothetical protein
MKDKQDTYLEHRIIGNGYPIVFLHGFLEDSSMWEHLNLPLKSAYKFVFIDLPGHGKSDKYNAKSIFRN